MYNLIIEEKENKTKILLVKDDEIIEQYEENINNIDGNIYVGKVQNILPKMKSIFVNIGQEKNALLHYKDLIISEQEISQKIKPGMNILVQVKKNEIGEKGAKLTQKINFAGKYIVLLPNEDFITASQKIDNNKNLIKEIRNILPQKMGAILRTASVENEEETIQESKEMLIQWEELEKASNMLEAPNVLYKADSRKIKIIKNLSLKLLEKIIVNTKTLYSEIEEILQKFKFNIKIELKENAITYDLQKQLDKLEKRKIWLKCGAYIVIDKTEALNVIDVNTGKYIGEKGVENTYLKVNEEATIEIAKQIRLRNLRGIILIDYINMHTYEEHEKIINLLKNEMQNDRGKHEIYGFTKLDLLEITRRSVES